MLEILQFTFSSFWIWLGTLIMLAVIGESLSGFVSLKYRIVKIEKKLKEEEGK